MLKCLFSGTTSETFVGFSDRVSLFFRAFRHLALDPESFLSIISNATMLHNDGMPDYSTVMRNSVLTTAELLESIERDIMESRLLIRAKNTDEAIASQLVSTLQEDNALLSVSRISCKVV